MLYRITRWHGEAHPSVTEISAQHPHTCECGRCAMQAVHTHTHLCGVIARAASLSTASLADLIASLDPQVWTEDQLEGLKTGLAEKLADCKERRPMQDYVCFPLYLDQQWWNMLQTKSSQAERFERLCRHVLCLGMRCPSEPTVAALVWLACCAFRSQDMMDGEKRSLLKEYKPKLKKWISQVQQPPVYLTVLPAVVADCPESLLVSAYPGGFQEYTPPGWSYEHYENMVRQFPLRQRKAEVPTETSNTSEGRGFFEMGRLLAGFAESALHTLNTYITYITYIAYITYITLHTLHTLLTYVHNYITYII